MKTLSLTIFSILLISTFGMAQSIGVFGGYLSSAFEDQEEALSAFELGGAFVIDALPVIDVGAEFSTTVSPFEEKSSVGGYNFTSKLNTTVIGVFGRYNIPLPALTPYLRVGAGYYSGSVEMEGDITGSADFKSAIGFNVGAGINTFTGLNAEFLYHIVTRELDVEGATSGGANYWGLRVGYYFSLL